MSTPEELAGRLTEAHTAFLLEDLSPARLPGAVAELVDDALTAGDGVTLAQLVDRDALVAVVRRLLDTVPASAGTNELLEAVLDVVQAGPAEPFGLGEVVDRDQVEALVDEVLALTPIVERALDRLAQSPLVGMVATRFMGRIVGEVLQANRAVTDKVPGLGSLMSLGTSAASKVMGAADRQFEQLLGFTADRGAAFAVRRLNRILVETMSDPTTREAILQVWDLVAEEPLAGLGAYVERDQVSRLAGAAQEVVATAAATGHAADLAEALVDSILARYGEHPVGVLLTDLEISRDDLVRDLSSLAPQAVTALRESGDLERLVRTRVAAFYDSAEARAILGS